MKTVNANITRALPIGARIEACDNSGAKVLQIISVHGHKTTRRRISTAGIGDLVTVSVIKGKPEMRKQKVLAVIARQKKEFKRPKGDRIKFNDNAAVVLKDDKGNPKGTMIKGPIAKEVTARWPAIAKIAKIVV